ncbi:MAG: hypothetical protein KC492_28255, partial [Myxococcales bacterium]|nr:hypothetical protein [Myxococcales bacterium]
MPPLNSLLVQRGACSMQSIEAAITRQVLRGGDLPTNLLEVSAVPEAALTAALAEISGMAAAPVGVLRAEPSALQIMQGDLALRHGIFPLAVEQGALVVATSEPLSPDVEHELGSALQVELRQVLALQVRIRQAIAEHYALALDARHAQIVVKLDASESGVVAGAVAKDMDKWVNTLRPIDSHRELDVVVELARDAVGTDGWLLLADEGARLLRKLQMPATWLMFVVALHQNGHVPVSCVEEAFEHICQTIFDAPGHGSTFAEEQLSNTQRAAACLSRLAEEIMPLTATSERFISTRAALDIMSRTPSMTVERLTETLVPRFPAMATEVQAIFGHDDERSATTHSPQEYRSWQEALVKLGNELDQAIGVHCTRGLALLNRIQVDNNRRVFRPLLEALLSEDSLSSQVVHDIRQLRAADLLDRHPLQTSAGGTRKISGNARSDTIRDYEEIANKLRQALDLRLKIDGRDKKDEGDGTDLKLDLLRYVAGWEERSVRAQDWLLVRLLRGETLVSISGAHLPDASLLRLDHAQPLRLAALFALAEPTTFAYVPLQVLWLHEPGNTLAELASALSKMAKEEVEWAELADALAGEHYYLEARVWASLPRAGVTGMSDMSEKIEAKLAEQRRLVLSDLATMESSWPKDVTIDDRRDTFLRHVEAARRFAEPGHLRLAREERAHAALLHMHAVRKAEEAQKQALGKARNRAFEVRQHLETAGGRRSIIERALDVVDEAMEKLPVNQAEVDRLLDLCERVFAGDMQAELTLREIFPAARATPQTDARPQPEPAVSHAAAPIPQQAVPVVPQSSPAAPALPPVVARQPAAELDRIFSHAEQVRARGDLPRAERLFREVLAQDAGHRRARSQLVTLLEQQRRRDEALRLLEEGNRLFPTHLPFLNQLVLVCGLMGRFQDAKRYAERGLSLCSNPEQETGFLNQLWRAEQRLGNKAKAIEHLRRLARQQPQVADHERMIARLQASMTRVVAVPAQPPVPPPSAALTAATPPTVITPPVASPAPVQFTSTAALGHPAALPPPVTPGPELTAALPIVPAPAVLSVEVTVEGEPDPEWGLLPEHLEISGFLEEDLRREYTKVPPDLLDVKGPERVVDSAVRLALEPMLARKPNTQRPGDEAERLRTAAKLLRELHDRRPDFDFASYVRQKYHGDSWRHLHHDIEEMLRRYLSYYASRMGDYHLLHARYDAARAYYLEYFRVFGELRMSSAIAAENYIRTWIDEALGFREKARGLLSRHRLDPQRLATETVLTLFALAIDEFLPDALKPPRASNAWINFLWGFIDICRVNEVARSALLRRVEQDEHPMRGAVERLVRLGALGLQERIPVEWVRNALEARREMHRTVSHDLEYLRESLLPARGYAQGIDLVARLRGAVQSELDQRLLGQTQEILRNAERYLHAPRFHEKSYFASDLQLRIANLQQDIEKEPTE